MVPRRRHYVRADLLQPGCLRALSIVLAVRFSITAAISRPCGGWRDRERLGEVFKRRAEKQHVFSREQGDE